MASGNVPGRAARGWSDGARYDAMVDKQWAFLLRRTLYALATIGGDTCHPSARPATVRTSVVDAAHVHFPSNLLKYGPHTAHGRVVVASASVNRGNGIMNASVSALELMHKQCTKRDPKQGTAGATQHSARKKPFARCGYNVFFFFSLSDSFFRSADVKTTMHEI